MKKIRGSFLVAVSIFIQASFASAFEWQTGDLVFQTSRSNQAAAIILASQSPYSHVGMIEIINGKAFVIEAMAEVKRTPADVWTGRGLDAHYAVYRNQNLTAEQKLNLAAAADKYLGRKYDYYFTSGNQELYCSELVELAYREVGLHAGRMQKIKELNVDNALVRALAERRWNKHPRCQGKVSTFEECWNIILQDTVITPAGLAADPQFKQIFSNFSGTSIAE